jgi:hypothetical protein
MKYNIQTQKCFTGILQSVCSYEVFIYSDEGLIINLNNKNFVFKII